MYDVTVTLSFDDDDIDTMARAKSEEGWCNSAEVFLANAISEAVTNLLNLHGTYNNVVPNVDVDSLEFESLIDEITARGEQTWQLTLSFNATAVDEDTAWEILAERIGYSARSEAESAEAEII